MTGQHDVDLLLTLCAGVPSGSRFIEIGPWLGFLTRIMAQRGPVHAIDNFIWTKAHAKRVPDAIAVNGSFEAAFFDNLADAAHPVTAFTGDFRTFEGSTDQFDFCVIDAPKTAEELSSALAVVLSCLAPDAPIVIINGKNPKHLEMANLIEMAVTAGILTKHEADGVTKSKAAVLRRGDVVDAGQALDQLQRADDFSAVSAQVAQTLQPAECALALAGLVEKNRWAEAYELLSLTDTSTELRAHWEDVEAKLNLSKIDPEQLGYFAHMIDACHQAAVSRRSPQQIHRSAIAAIEEFWFRNARNPWRGASFHPEIIARAQSTGYLRWPSEIANAVQGKRVLDVGCGRGLHGLGVLTAGATGYTGIDPEMRLDTDMIKDLVTKEKVRFGYNGERLRELFPPLSLFRDRIETFHSHEKFDLALLHMVTPNLADLPRAFEAIADLLSDGGEVIIKHRNFYAWNGHQIAPNTVSKIDESDPRQVELIDWRHLTFDPPPDHFIARKLNRASLVDLLEALEARFEVTEWVTTASTEQQGLGRLNANVTDSYPHLSQEDFETQSVFCRAKLR